MAKKIFIITGEYSGDKHASAVVSELRTTQHINKSLFQLVPMQNFSNNSDIDWKCSIEDIDKQLNSKYNI